ncbi:hypothetical protein FRZ67_15520 [Panacibacter ginsenosidivorans]|uniref:SlyX family protein n=1 Tax=Panacibacter ginsenosidivorans TaxID=1813871 RepID=A0A5B8VAZ2_9BACT|nr:hypothetical protein [Panacibacter ginsenosidivorans]QEC68647.1 hypothetical protein FRZ67_15520 [Panacibacter ginsenosidivorans]
MKKLVLLIAISCFSVMSFAQPETEFNIKKPDTSAREVIVSQERVAKLEKEIEELKASHAELQRQLAEIKNHLPVVKKRKPVVSRVGSKQGVWVEE